ncbi:MAG: CHAT domain-containing protein [Sphingomonadales bacterium]|nr:CHAT domain-containing protein [Sphingomonadales bacterium]MBD3774802.1 CHAT domain-containing protein [Paracoccaceae bacterium]
MWATGLFAIIATPLAAQERPVLLRDSFPIGASGGILCQVQDRSVGNPARQTMFDRNWAVVCRDSARPVSTVYAFREPVSAPEQLVERSRREKVECAEAAARVAGVDGLLRRQCMVSGTSLGWSVYAIVRGGTTYIADGFSAYDSATMLALLSVLEDRPAQGVIDVATTSVSDPFAFARIQAETLEPGQALAEGYRRNLGGDYAEAAAYFETLQQRLEGERDTQINPGEFLVNRALQRSNLGQFGEADRLFIEAEPLTANDPVAARLQRNFEAINLINQGYVEQAIARLDRPISAGLPSAEAFAQGLEISEPIAARINGEGDGGGLLGFVDEVKLSPLERAAILDAQALQVRGTALRLLGRPAEAKAALLDSYAKAVAVRDGRVTSIARLRAQVLGELGLIAEGEGDLGGAENFLQSAIAILEGQFPQRRAVSGAKARLGAFMLRHGREAEGLALYREVVGLSIGQRDAATGFSNQLFPYFALIAPRVESDPAAADEFFRGSQILVRPGVAETQAVLARELSAGDGEAARLFRQSTDLAREIERSRIRYAALGSVEQTAQTRAARTELAASIDTLEAEQMRTQAELAKYPQYRVVAPRSLDLAQLRAVLRPGEAYARLADVGGQMFVFYADRDGAKAWALGIGEEELGQQVDTVRASISLFDGGQYLTYPYDIEAGRKLYVTLFGPVADRMASVKHLIFEPDAAMLRLPVEVLVTDDASVERYLARVNSGGDPYDFTGTAWLGRDRMVSTAVSAQSFVDAREAPRSAATREYLGLGDNAPLGKDPPPAIAAKLQSKDNPCAWPLDQWNRPIDPSELENARAIAGGTGSSLMIGSQFSDTAVRGRPDLDQYRVLHFATHGLVTAPSPACQARPALLTSFGGDASDGLLSFDEIFDLDIDADIVILSACDTAGQASVQATREAGLGSGGGTALDGLVRAFVGAGSRAVIASHWPAPDEFDATKRLMDGMFRFGRNRDVGDALAASRRELMDRPDTSHPYYWAGFAIIGDAARPLLSDPAAGSAAATQTGQ